MNRDSPETLTLRQRLRFLAKDSILYGGAASFNKAFALLTFPMLARHFPVEAYGVYDFLNVSVSLLAIILVFGQDSAVARFFYEHPDRESRRAVISQSFFFQTGILALTLILLWLGADRLAGWSGQADVDGGLVRLLLLQIPFLVLINFSQNILKWTFSRAQFLTISLGSTVVSMSALLIGLYWFDVGLVEIFSIFLGTRAAFGLLGLWFCRRWLVWPADWRFLKPMVLFAAPYGIICAVSASIPALERTFIVGFLGERELGLFAAGAKIAMMMSLPIQAFQVAWGPFSLALHKQADAHVTYNHVLRGFSMGILVLAMLLAVVAEPAIRLLASSQYAGASIVVFPLAMAFAFQGLSGIVTVGITLSKKSYLNLFSYFLYLAVTIGGIYLLIGRWGLAGVAWGGMLGRLAMTAAEAWLSQRVYPLSWGFRSLALGYGVTLAWGLAGQAIFLQVGMWPGMAFSALGLAVVLPAMVGILFTRAERQRIRMWLARQWRDKFSAQPARAA